MRAAVVVGAMCSLAHAEPYPQQLVERPILLPRGTAEASGMLVARTSDQGNTFSVVPDLVFQPGNAELEVGLDILLVDDPPAMPAFDRPEANRLSGAYAALRIGHCAWSYGGELIYASTFANEAAYVPRFVVGTKYHASTQSALEARGFAGASIRRLGVDPLDTATFTQFLVGAELRAQAQISSRVAVEGIAGLFLLNGSSPVAISGRLARVSGTSFDLTAGAQLRVSASPSLDVVAGFEVAPIATQLHTWTIGVVARRLP